jgi:hypothetical protein
MNGGEREANSSGATPKSEHLNAVLGRFQSWARAYREDPETGSWTNLGKAEKSGGLQLEVREVSYEQALRAGKRHRPTNPIPPPREGVSPPIAAIRPEQKTVVALETHFSNKLSVTSQPPVRRSRPPKVSAATAAAISARAAARIATIEPAITPSSATQFTVLQPAARKVVATPAAPTPVAAKPTAPPPPLATRSKVAARPTVPVQARKTVSVPALLSKPAKPASSAGNAATKRKVRRPAKADRGSLNAAPSPRAIAKPTVSKAIPPKAKPARQRPEVAFRDVFEGTTGLATTLHTESKALEPSKPSWLTLRISDQEQARIQACAAQADLSVSAYIRQCARDFDQLRNQVESALSKLEQRQEVKAPVAPPPGITAIPGILTRFAQQYLRPGRRKPAGYQALSLR